MLVKRSERYQRRRKIAGEQANESRDELDRRIFLMRSGIAAGALAALGNLPLAAVRKANAGPPPRAGATMTTRKNICTHCSVGCSGNCRRQRLQNENQPAQLVSIRLARCIGRITWLMLCSLESR